MVGLTQIVRHAVYLYAAGHCLNCKTYASLDDEHQVYAAIVVSPEEPELDRAGLIVLARIVGDAVIVEYDSTNKPLVDALLQADIPREKIVLAYEGETVPSEVVSQQTVS